MKKILFIVNVDTFFISHRLPIGTKAIESGYEVHIACKITTMDKKLKKLGFHVHPLDLDRSSMGIKSNTITMFQIARLLHRLKPEITHLVSIKPILLGGIAARLLKAKSTVFAVSGLGFIFTAEGFLASIKRKFVVMLYSFALHQEKPLIIFQNLDDQKTLLNLCRIPVNKTTIIKGSGVDLKNFHYTPYPKETVIVLMASRLLHDKGVCEFVHAAQRLKAHYPCTRFVLVGEPDFGNPTSVSQTKLDNWVEKGLVEYWGQRNDMPKVLSLASIVVLPSYREGLPKILIEAAASGRAVVTTNVAGCRDAIKPNITGLLVESKDSIALSCAIKKLLDNPKKCIEMGENGRTFAENNFAIELVVNEHMRIYEELLQNK